MAILSDQAQRHPIDALTACVSDRGRAGRPAAGHRGPDERRAQALRRRRRAGDARRDRVQLGASPRASLSLMKAAQALALTEGRAFVAPEDVPRDGRAGHRPPHGRRAPGEVRRRDHRGNRRGNPHESPVAVLALGDAVKRLLYRWFSSFSAFQYRLDRRFTRAGSLALSVLGAAAVIGLDTNRTVGYQVLTLVLALLLISAASSLVFRRTLRRPARPAALRLGRRSAHVSRGDRQPDEPPPGRSGAARGAGRSAPVVRGVHHGPRAGRGAAELVRSAGRVPALGLARLAEARCRRPAAAPAPLAPSAETDVTVELTPLRRGHVRFTGLTVARPDPWG